MSNSTVRQGKKETFHRPNDSKITNREPREVFLSPLLLFHPPRDQRGHGKPIHLNSIIFSKTERNWIGSTAIFAVLSSFPCNNGTHWLCCWAPCHQAHQLELRIGGRSLENMALKEGSPLCSFTQQAAGAGSGITWLPPSKPRLPNCSLQWRRFWQRSALQMSKQTPREIKCLLERQALSQTRQGPY